MRLMPYRLYPALSIGKSKGILHQSGDVYHILCVGELAFSGNQPIKVRRVA
jgi:hypothetical protein